MNVCLFALTGFGNSVLSSLLKLKEIRSFLVITRKEKGPFPYYCCDQLVDLCRKKSIKSIYHTNFKLTHEIVNKFSPDVIIISTFHKKIPKYTLRIAKIAAINIHPSLLPKYRGPNPTNWAIISGERSSGITIHLAGDALDKGDILFQRKISICGMNDGQLRKYLAKLTGDHIGKFVRKLIISTAIKPLKINKSRGSYYPKITSKRGTMLLRCKRFKEDDIIRGLTPYPSVDAINGYDIKK